LFLQGVKSQLAGEISGSLSVAQHFGRRGEIKRKEEYRGTNNYSTALVGGWSAPREGDEANQHWCHIRDFERHGRSLNEEAE